MNIKLDVNQIALLLLTALMLFAAGWLWTAEKRLGSLEQGLTDAEAITALDRRVFRLECKARIAPECSGNVMSATGERITPPPANGE